MLVPMSFLKEYVDVHISTDDFAERMILSGSNIETVDIFGEGITNVVIGRIESIRPHEDSDHLLISMVNIGNKSATGDGLLQIVTGAPNIFEGAIVPVALDGSTLPGGVNINKGVLRGVESNGMLCSASELGFDEKVAPLFSKDGILILGEEFANSLGEDIVDALELRDEVIDFEITPNRPDCLSIIGMARETAATLGEEIHYPQIKISENSDKKTSDVLRVDINKPEFCPRYVGRVISDIKIDQSPWWLQRRLMLCGMRPINNIVDITNYVLLEMGHPIHAFDIRQVEGAHIVVDTAKDGDSIVTLDSNERKLYDDVLLIKDEKKGIGIAGIMGGENSEILADTSMAIIEAASFNADNIRKSSKKLGLRTEASTRYEKGVDTNMAGNAADRVCSLVSQIGCGVVLSGSLDNYPNKLTAKTIKARPKRINDILATDLSAEEMISFLNILGIKTDLKTEGVQEFIYATPPTYRADLKEEIDLVEEVGRLYGFDKLGQTLHPDGVSAYVLKPIAVARVLRNVLVDLGVYESSTYSFVSPNTVDRVGLAADDSRRNFVKLINPLGEDTSVMRTSILPNTLEVLELNYRRSMEEAYFFELGNTFANTSDDEGFKSTERMHLCLGLYGLDMDFFKLKGIISEALRIVGVERVSYEVVCDSPTYHAGRTAGVWADGVFLGLMGELDPDIAGGYGLPNTDVRTYAAELDFDSIVELADDFHMYKPLPKFPSTSRDVSLIVDIDTAVGTLEEIIRGKATDLLESVKLFDIYQGEQVPEGKKSLSFSIVYRSDTQTLVDEDVDKIQEGVIEALQQEASATVRM